jgi:hypothetical protein
MAIERATKADYRVRSLQERTLEDLASRGGGELPLHPLQAALHLPHRLRSPHATAKQVKSKLWSDFAPRMRSKREEFEGATSEQAGSGEMIWGTELTVLLSFEAMTVSAVLEQSTGEEQRKKTNRPPDWFGRTSGCDLWFSQPRVSSPLCHLKIRICGHFDSEVWSHPIQRERRLPSP